MNKMDEQILAVDRDYLFDEGRLTFQGATDDPELVSEINKRLSKYEVVRRGDAEHDRTLKQPIPYTVIKRGDAVFLYKRLSGGGETRLHDQLSIGVGGHMNKINDITNWHDTLFFNMAREISEELTIKEDHNLDVQILGLINDDEDPQGVGQYHIGILTILELPESIDVEVRETEQLEGYWIRYKDLEKAPLFGQLENWSQIAIKMLLPRS